MKKIIVYVERHRNRAGGLIFDIREASKSEKILLIDTN